MTAMTWTKLAKRTIGMPTGDPKTRLRLDDALVTAGLAPSRSRARDMVLRGTVTVDGIIAGRPGRRIATDARLQASDPAAGYVSRAALKLIAGLDAFGFDPAGQCVLDLGASTGGFTQVLLERGAAHVIALDVGHGQMAPDLAGDERLTLLEGVNARHLTRDHLAGRAVRGIACDVSFISLKLALPRALGLAEPGAWGVFLVKPQFEAGLSAISKSGLVPPQKGEESAKALAAWLSRQAGWSLTGRIASPVRGGTGNREYLLGARHD
jgi:23S rRNA (cytidine1920-2'-O)/16S rRNA (cytidine1409-2'-O)-methyltransferase